MLLKGRKQEVLQFWSCLLRQRRKWDGELWGWEKSSHLTDTTDRLQALPAASANLGSWPIFLGCESSVSCGLLLSILSGIFFIEAFPGLCLSYHAGYFAQYSDKQTDETIKEGRLELAHSSRGQSIIAGKAW